MFKKAFFIVLVGIFLFFFACSKLLIPGDFAFFIKGGLGSGQKVFQTDYEWIWNTDYVDVNEYGAIIPNSSMGISISAGLSYFFSPSFGISTSISYIKQDVNLGSDYNFLWTWYDGESNFRERSWYSSGSISAVPITLDLVYKTIVNKNSSVCFYVGFAAFLSKADLTSHVGYGETLETQEYYYMDWYDVGVKIEQSDTILGGNIGVEFERKIGLNHDFFVGIQYFYAPSKKYKWEVVPKSVYEGEEEQLYRESVPDIHVNGDIRSEINFSFYRVYIGIRIHI